MESTKQQLRNLIYVSVISADNDEFGLSEEDKQEIMRRYKLGMSWDTVFEPIPDDKKRKKLIDFFEET